MISLRKVGAGGTAPHAQTHPVPPVHVLKPHNVILAQIAARLHLEHFQRHLAGISLPIRCSCTWFGSLALRILTTKASSHAAASRFATARVSQEGKLHPCWPQESSVALRLRPANFTRFLPSQMFFRALSIATTDGQKRRSRLKPTALLVA
jgi:hypothetical protein